MRSEDVEHLTAAASYLANIAYLVFAAVLMADHLQWDWRRRLKELRARFLRWKHQREFEAFYRLWSTNHAQLSGE